MHPYHRRLIPALFALSWFLVAQNLAAAQLPSQYDRRSGMLDADLVVLVKPHTPDWFRIEETYLGNHQPGEILHLQDFALFKHTNGTPDTLEQITPDTRILFFLKNKIDEPSEWEICCNGNSYFWVDSPDKVEELSQAVGVALMLRKKWEAVLEIPKEKEKVETLWKYMWNNSLLFQRHAKAELERVGAVAGDYIAEQWEQLNGSQRNYLLRDAEGYGSPKLHYVLLAHLKKLQQSYESYVEKNSADAGNSIDYLANAPIEIKNLTDELFYGLVGLRTFKNSSDLPYIRELAQWAMQHHFAQVCDAALCAFRDMPEIDNLPLIEAITNQPTQQLWEEMKVEYKLILDALKSHPYPQAVPILVRLLDNQMLQEEVRRQLAEIVGKDLGYEKKVWLDWYKTQKGKEQSK